MAHRQEEKEKRRREREQAEQAEAEAQARKKRLTLIGGGIVALAALVGLVLAFTSLLGDDAKDSDGPSGGEKVAIPGRKIADLDAAAAAAGCKVVRPPDRGRQHTAKSGVVVKYATDPPTSGEHDPVPADDGIYEAGNEPTPMSTIHALEHGRLSLQYAEGTPARRIKQLETLFGEETENLPGGYHLLLYQNRTMPFAVAASAWNNYIGCKTFGDKVFDALRAFRVAYTDRAPELVP